MPTNDIAFGLKTVRYNSNEQKNMTSFIPEQDEDGTLSVISAGGAAYGQYINLESSIKTDAELITRYRRMAEHPTLNSAITCVVNEAIIVEPEEKTVALDLTNVRVPEATKKTISDEFDNILRLFDFEHNGYEMFRRWYIDGRMYYHAIVDPENQSAGISELRYIDPRKIRKVREITPGTKGEVETFKTINEFFLFTESGFGNENVSSVNGPKMTADRVVKISKDAVIHTTSGVMDPTGKTVVSYLHKAIRPLNILNMLEDAVVIYRLSRAPERRVFYIETGGMSPAKAEQYMNGLITNMKNKVTYDSESGTIRDQRKFATMFEDFWLPRREGRGTEVTTLPSGENLGRIEDVEYFQKRLYQSLEVPYGRLNPDDVYSTGRGTEISREEIAFEKFITRLRSRFALCLLKALRLQLILKRVIGPDDWKELKNDIGFVFAKDNLFAELKNNEVMQGRLALLGQMAPYIGRYWSNEYVRTNILKQSDKEIREEDQLIKDEMNNPQYLDPLDAEPQMPGDQAPMQ